MDFNNLGTYGLTYGRTLVLVKSLSRLIKSIKDNAALVVFYHRIIMAIKRMK